MKKNNHLRSQGDKEIRRQDNSTSNLTPHSTLRTPLNIPNDDIVSVARELRDEENAQLQVPPFYNMQATKRTYSLPSLTGRGRGVGLWLAAACLVGFLFGFGLRPTVSSLLSQGAEESGGLGATPTASVPYAATVSQPSPCTDTITLREVAHDTVFQTRVIIRNAAPHPVVAQAENAPTAQGDASRQQAEASQEAAPAVGCSMLCDDIPYAILARN